MNSLDNKEEDILDTIDVKIKKKLEQKNDLIIRISSLSDEILLEQARAEFLELEIYIDSLEIEYIHWYFVCLSKEYRRFYEEMFEPETDIIISMERNNKELFENMSLLKYMIDNRLRIPTGIKDRRLLAMLSNTIGRQILILDMESIIFDDIGKIYDVDPIKLYINCILRIDHIDTLDINNITILVHKKYIHEK